MKKFFFTLFLFSFFTSSMSGIKSFTLSPIKHTGHLLLITFSNKYFQKYGSCLFFIYAQGVCDAKWDGWNFDNRYDDGITYGIQNYNSHFYKNIGRTFTAFAFVLKGLSLGQKHSTYTEALIMTISEGFIAWTIWHKVYYKTRYNNYWDTNHAQRIICYPNPLNKLNDAYICMRGNQVFYFDFIRLFIGITGLLKLSF